MENKNIIIILSIIVVILAIATFLSVFKINPLDPYKDVDEEYIRLPINGEKVRFTGTYLGPDDAFLYNYDKSRGVIQVGNSYVLISTSKVQGLEGKTITVEGCFYNDKIDGDVVPINNKYVYGEHFYIDNVIDN